MNYYENLNTEVKEYFKILCPQFPQWLIEYIETPMNYKVKVYDIERCICDIIRSKGRMDLEHVKYSVKQYIRRKDKDLVKLSKYAEEFGIKEEVMDFISMMYE